MRARWTILGALAVAAIASPAVGQTELDPADRALIHSYSPEAMQLLWATTGGTATAETCEIEEGTVYTFTEDADGVVIQSAEGEVVTDGCELTATDVQGPNGQVNHGTVVSSFVHALREAGYEGGIGCHVRAIAQTDYGKGEQQVRTPDAGSLPVDVTDREVDFTITETDCAESEREGETATEEPAGQDRGASEAKGNSKARGKGNETGKPEWAGTPGPPPHAKGKGRP